MYCSGAVPRRTYLTFCQQLLAEHVQAAAKKYTGPEAKTYQSAADSWRMPYWDWAVDRTLPDVVIAENMTFHGPEGNITIANPFLRYTFQNFPLNSTLFPADDDSNLSRFTHTVRCPDPWTNRSNDGMAGSYVEAINLAGQVVSIDIFPILRCAKLTEHYHSITYTRGSNRSRG